MAKTVSRNVRAQRKKLGLKEPGLIARGVPAGTAHRTTAGDPEAEQDVKLSTLERLAKALELPAWKLLVPGFNADEPPKLLLPQEIEEEIARRTNARVADILREATALHDDPEKARPDGRSVGKPFTLGPIATLESGGSVEPVTAKPTAKRAAKAEAPNQHHGTDKVRRK